MLRETLAGCGEDARLQIRADGHTSDKQTFVACVKNDGKDANLRRHRRYQKRRVKRWKIIVREKYESQDAKGLGSSSCLLHDLIAQENDIESRLAG